MLETGFLPLTKMLYNILMASFYTVMGLRTLVVVNLIYGNDII